MIQRMGRILRRKRPGVGARFVIMFAKDTLEDPAYRIERDGFLDEIERIAEALAVFDSSRFDELNDFLARPGPVVIPEPSRVSDEELAGTVDAVIVPAIPDESAYLELEVAALPPIAAPKVVAKRLSTGHAPLEIASVGSGWQISCTGCGESSTLVRFRWQALDQTVDCRCA